MRLSRENLDNSNRFLLPTQRNREHGANAQRPAALPIHTNIDLGVIAAKQRSALHALARKTRAHL